jgi:hypothetical protein
MDKVELEGVFSIVRRHGVQGSFQVTARAEVAFISGLFTFFGALTGFLGLLYLARRSDRSTKEQLVYTRNRERREEAFNDLSQP